MSDILFVALLLQNSNMLSIKYQQYSPDRRIEVLHSLRVSPLRLQEVTDIVVQLRIRRIHTDARQEESVIRLPGMHNSRFRIL